MRDGDRIDIDIPARSITLAVSEEELTNRRQQEEARGALAFTPQRDRAVSKALQAYARFAASADKGAVREL